MADETTPEATKEVAAEIKELGDKLVALTVLQARDLKDYLKDEHGIEAAAGGVVMAGPAAGGGGGGDEAEEKTSFDVILSGAGDRKIPVIKVVREITSLGLKEAKELVDNAPKPVKEGATKEEADEIKAKLEEAGAAVEIK
jgi:large subunit ribosomal protein L7/L12